MDGFVVVASAYLLSRPTKMGTSNVRGPQAVAKSVFRLSEQSAFSFLFCGGCGLLGFRGWLRRLAAPNRLSRAMREDYTAAEASSVVITPAPTCRVTLYLSH